MNVDSQQYAERWGSVGNAVLTVFLMYSSLNRTPIFLPDSTLTPNTPEYCSSLSNRLPCSYNLSWQ